MGKMKELAYQMERLEKLFRYLDLLSEIHKGFGFTNHVIVERMLTVCNEIEAELGIRLDK